MEFIFSKPEECNLHMVREFYVIWAPKARYHFVTVKRVEMPITPAHINDLLSNTRQ